jgi:signal transduction histidine kinase
VVHIRDCGIGIAADSMPYIFDLLVRAEATAVRKRSGLGLGSEFTVRLKLGS